jgi:glycerophosphoryl diester phosphodiesterase
MKLRKIALLLLSGAGLYSVANYSAAAGNVRERKRILDDKNFWIIAHRGFSARYPENTMLAFEQAAALQIDAIELDVHSTRDGRIVVIHDSTLDRTTDRNGRVFDHTWDLLRKADAGFMFDPDGSGKYPFRGQGLAVPLLEDVFKKFPKMKFIVEIKQELPAIEEVVYRLIRKYKMEKQVIVASEHSEPLNRFRNIDPLVATSLSSEEAYELYKMYRLRMMNFYRCRGDALQIPEKHNGKQVLRPSLIAAAKRKGLAVHIWTVNDPVDMKRLMDWGVDGIISDDPGSLLAVAAARGTKRKFSAEESNGHSRSKAR